MYYLNISRSSTDIGLVSLSSSFPNLMVICLENREGPVGRDAL